MRNLSLAAGALLALTPCLLAQTVVVSNVARNGTTGNVWRAGTNRVQCFYDASTFTSQGVTAPIVITQIKWFQGSAQALPPVVVTYPSIDVFLQDSAVDFASPSVTFAANRSELLGTANFSGPVTTIASPVGTPGGVMVDVTLTTPFVYAPSSGQDLLIEFAINAAPAPLTGNITGTSFSTGHLANSVRSVGSVVALSGAISAFCPNVELTYNTAVTNVASSIKVGAGCYNRPHAFYESFVDPNLSAVAGLDIDPNTSAGAINGLDLFNVGDNWIVTRNSTPGLFIVPGTSPNPTQLNALAPTLSDSPTNPADDCHWTRPLPFAFPYPGNVVGTTSVHVSSNGIVSLAVAPPAGSLYAFDQGPASNYAGFAARVTLAPCWQDMEPADLVTFLGGAGDVWMDTDNTSYVAFTWNNVREWIDPLAYAGPNILSTIQLVLTPGGTAYFRYGSIGANHLDCARLVGFSYGDSIDAGSGPTPRQNPDLSVATAPPGYVSGDGARAAIMGSTFRPKVGKPLQLTTTAFDNQSVFNISLISTTPLPGIDLTVLDMPGCNAYVLLPEAASDFQLATPTVTWNVLPSIPAAFAGATVYAQAAQLLNGLPNPRNIANIVVSDSIVLTFDIN